VPSCLVCGKHKNFLAILPGGVIFQNQHIFAAHFPLIENEPAHYGHIILEFKRHITKPSEMTPAECLALGFATQKISNSLESTLGAEHVYIVRIGDVTPHLHFHFVPRFSDTSKEFWGPLLFRWPGSRKATAQDMIAVSEKMRGDFTSL
jgi:diadenosine tetraphosphate (Ap4A) HIT family hydrolase